ncbi:anthranilate synthase component I family protein [Rathayibacter soli]|uniref:anthranilate synthase component I family protein n=1 Tax=Rathayibacter soli TaxID=3144168 RepID=UPI0027E41A54|nr:anthranilate synthase component I family protein [Glaciibacter superstes]
MGHEDAFWLDGGPDGDSLFGFGSVISGDETLKEIDRCLGAFRARSSEATGPQPGFVGWIPYDFTRRTLLIDLQRDGEAPEVSFIRAEHIVRIDNRSGDIEIAVFPQGDNQTVVPWREAVAQMIRQSRLGSDTDAPPCDSPVSWTVDDDEYGAKISRCQDEIASGNAYVLCLTTRVIAPGAWDDLETFIALRESSPSHHGALVRIGATSLVSCSPERFIEVAADRTIRTHPIKGTRRRSDDREVDDALRDELRSDEKERSENLMIVDLMRNDLARVCTIGSVGVERLFAVETYPHVHQLVSTIVGTLLDGAGAAEIISAVFPAGSMTGAPKAMAVRLLDAMESSPRGLYAGAFGLIGLDGTIDLAMSIRCVEIHEGYAQIGTGGGITAMSDRRAEVDEIHLKAAAPMAALRSRVPSRELAGAGV